MVNLDIAAAFNAAEAVWWWIVAAVVARPPFESDRLRSGGRWVVVAAFAAFGVSDVIEYFTGAWWRPCWLLVLRIACIGTFIAVVIRVAVRAKCAKASTLGYDD